MIDHVVCQILAQPPRNVAPKQMPKPASLPSEPAVAVVHLSDEEEEKEEEEQNDNAFLEEDLESPADIAVDIPAPSESSSLRRPREDEADDSDLQLPAESQQEEGTNDIMLFSFCAEGNSLNVVLLTVGRRLGNCKQVTAVRNASKFAPKTFDA